MASTTARRHRMRCNACKYTPGKGSGRFTLRKHWREYKRPPKCPGCGETVRVVSVEKDRRSELARQTRCYCGGVPFPHKKGTVLGCSDHPRASQEWTEQENYDYQAMWETPRGG